jgi:hypothetical protein
MFMPTIREQIGEELYSRLETEAEKEVALAIQFAIIDQYRQERYYYMSPLLTSLVKEFQVFQEKGFKFTPIDIVRILFKSKLLFPCQTEQEYIQRSGGSGFMEEPPFRFRWEERNQTVDEVTLAHLNLLNPTITERTLATEITNFNTHPTMGNASEFLSQLFTKLDLPFNVHINDNSLPDGVVDDGSHRPETGRIAFTATGTYSYVYFYASAQLRTFLNVLRIAGFLYKGQVDFGMWGIVIMAPTSPWFLNTNEMSGGYSWKEDERKPWEKIPDGCLFLSFGYRGISTLFLDNRTFAGIEKVFIDNSLIFKELKNPWNEKCITDIATSLDILSTATQMPDLGAKILQIYCCLEHLFVPKNVQKDNIKYIVGAINVLNPSLLPWFDKLYKLRCDYAHKGYVQKDDQTLFLVFESMGNTMALLTAKLKQS